MHPTLADPVHCSIRAPVDARERERGVRAVVLLTAAMMVVEVVVGYLTGSMALLADGWHMATHVAALGLASAAYALSRRFAGHRAFAFGTGKIQALGGYTSAVALGLVALLMMVEAASRLLQPATIDFAGSLPVAVLGLFVNLASYRLLHGEGHEHEHEHEGHEHEHEGHEHEHEGHEHEHEHEGHEHEHEHEGHPGHGARGHDHNHRAAVLHVAADALTSLLAILALLAGRYLGLTWLDPLMGIVGGVVILKWGLSLCKHAAFDLLDVDLSSRLEDGIRSTLEAIDDVRVRDLHVWSLGRGDRGCIISLVSSTPRESAFYKQRLGRFGLMHLTVEVARRTDEDARANASGARLV
jgi:cation diffusion facilitator family transporter